MSRTAPATSPAPVVPSAWADVVARYLEALRLTHYAADTVHIRTLYLKYFVAWATARGLTTPAAVTRAALERYQLLALSLPQAHRHAAERVEPARPARRGEGPVSLADQAAGAPHEPRRRARAAARDRAAAAAAAHRRRDHRRARACRAHDADRVRDRALLETGYSTGLRRMELIRLRLYDLDLARGVLVVREGKGQKDRVVPIGERAIAWLEKYLDEARPDFVVEPDEGTVFLTRRGRPFHPNNLSRLTRDYLVAAGIAKRGACHLLRHTMATGMLEHGADVRVIQEILGHARLTTTQLYTRVSIRLLKAVHTATHPAATLARPVTPPAAIAATEQLEKSASLLAAKEEAAPPTA